MGYKAVFIDMDGVLVLTEKKHYLAWKKVLEQLSLAIGSFEEQDVVGVADINIAQRLITQRGLPYSSEELCNIKRGYFLNEMLASIASPQGRDAFLIKAKEKHKLAVVSSSSKEEINALLKAEKIIKYFDFIVGAEDTFRHKPFPDPYLKALALSQLSFDEVFAIEDSPSGIKSALAANLKVFGIASYMHNYAEDLTVKFFKDFNQLAKAVFVD